MPPNASHGDFYRQKPLSLLAVIFLSPLHIYKASSSSCHVEGIVDISSPYIRASDVMASSETCASHIPYYTKKKKMGSRDRNKTSLYKKLEKLRSATHSTAVKVETLENGFLINVFSEKNCPGLLMSILEAFEELGLDVLDARVSCSDNFHLEAISENEGPADSIDAQVVKRAVLEAIRNWSDDQD
ncbi:hypothetical protein PHJA_000465600 [Phtheirospermum japonicum]|uniref:Plant bHLH transcription factor ACT-like domain-containing protein n=1 Tax=Phtheirospermum japonicum TaxID=374723 RepID=A0A830BAZ2_9LAMI|nr:hypothetical protein PHJA_000465600 [Phtheirospermum japonicum]